MTGVMAIKPVSIEVQRSGSMLRSPWRPRGHVTPPSIFSRAPHISGRTDDIPWKMVYFSIHTGMANARVPPLAAISEWSPGPSSPPRRWPELFIRLAMTVLPSL
jgi:hypothetical protein